MVVVPSASRGRSGEGRGLVSETEMEASRQLTKNVRVHLIRPSSAYFGGSGNASLLAFRAR